MIKQKIISLLVLFLLKICSADLTYQIVGTGVNDYYNDKSSVAKQSIDEPFYGQDAHYPGLEFSYTNNGDGTITDNTTGLMWESSMGEKISYVDVFTKMDTSTLGGYEDWRVPTIKELYSLINFTGYTGQSTANCFKYIDTAYFEQPFGDTTIGERYIDAQTWSASQYVGTTMNGDTTIFGVNFIDGRIKGYPKNQPGNSSIRKTAYFRLVRGNPYYAKNRYKDNGDGTITDSATGLMWQQSDDGIARDWEEALNYSENLSLAGYDDWKLPNAKELHSIVDYERSPSTTNSAAIDPIFNCTEITYPDGNFGHYPFYWTSTTHLDGIQLGKAAVYICFGEALGEMNGNLMDVHGAGAQRSDPKSGDPSDYPQYWGPQGDIRYVYNYARCVRNADLSQTSIKSEFNNVSKTKFKTRLIRKKLFIDLNLSNAQNISVDLLTVNGKKIFTLFCDYLSSGDEEILIALKPNISKGIYLISVKGDYLFSTKKLIIQ